MKVRSRIRPDFGRGLVAKLDLNLIPHLRQLLVRADFVARDRGEHFFVRHAEAHVVSFDP
jgi:hypothetical protein